MICLQGLESDHSVCSDAAFGIPRIRVVGDACVAMDEWVDHPHAHTALDDILPCVDVATADESIMQRSKQVTFQLVNLVNQVIVNISNADFPPGMAPLYYNQSGPPAPPLCNPYLPDMSNRTCLPGEVDFNSASKVWKSHVCQTARVGGSEVCTTVGRITPSIYYQMTAATNVSHGLYYYGPFLAQLADCTFVRETFAALASNNCPGLDLYSKWIFVGLVILSAAVMFSSTFWMVYARERRHRKQLSGRERVEWLGIPSVVGEEQIGDLFKLQKLGIKDQGLERKEKQIIVEVMIQGQRGQMVTLILHHDGVGFVV
ncbi:hypothetical protein C4D60_Mb03t20810 [Musa balbisiana]|uniref:Uncharacterized protein n=1 Tax=Musa balbisiana TaxID=52838 RepID=A0A4S8JDV1_MUSBA|nr:hypothetical protein C4D60_Mb03t20810 [Musa balbisiana]